MKIIVPAEKLAAAVNQYLIPGWIRKHSQESTLKKEAQSAK
jgi:hypothetical protein